MYAMAKIKKEKRNIVKYQRSSFLLKRNRASSDKALHVQSGRIYLKTIP